MRLTVAALAIAVLSTAACDPCAGTPSCHTEPEISYTGQFIEFPSGKSVGGVSVTFVRRRGSELVNNIVSATSNADGFFVLRMQAFQDGAAEGDLTVTPPAPHSPYTIRGIRLATHRTRGDGVFIGRLMVNPYLQFIGELHDRKTFEPVAGASVTIRQIGPTLVEPATSPLSSAENGRFMWEPKIVQFDNQLVVDFEVSANGYPRSYVLRDTIPLQYLDEPPRLLVLMVGGGWSYIADVRRRGTKEVLPGVTVEFTRTGGINAVPDRFTATVDQNGRFSVPMEPSGDGTLIGDLTIRPSAPLPVETYRDVELVTFDGGKTRVLAFGYGPATIARPVLVYRATGRPIAEATHARFTHVGGLPDVMPAPWGVVPDSGIRIVDSTGTVAYDAATLDSGIVLYDIEVRLNYPHSWDTVRAIPVPARNSDKPAVDTLRVGSWFPWIGELRDAVTDAPVSDATVRFVRKAGGRVRPALFTVQSRSDGTFPIQPEPLDTGSVDAVIMVQTGGRYRETAVTVRIRPAQDDIMRSIGVIRLIPAQP
jgi:hypothetical protein